MINKPLALGIVAIGIAGAAGIWYWQTQGTGSASTATTATSQPVRSPWSATAPGRVEPRGGEIRISTSTPGRVAEVAVRVNDRVHAGDLLVRLEDDELRARTLAADAELAVRRRDRDNENVNRLAQDRRVAEDNVTVAERNLITQRLELDRLTRLLRSGTGGVTEEQVNTQRNAVTTAVDRVDQERAALRRAQTATNVPVQTRLEAAVTAARADVSVAEAMWERTRIRAPIDGTVLQVLTRGGELAAASPEQTLVVVGDMTALRVRAELEERDAAKVRPGQSVVVRSDAFPGVEYAGRVTSVAQAVAPPRIAQRGPRRPNELDTVEVMVDLDAGGTLLAGMRVDVFFRAESSSSANAGPRN